MARAKRQDKLMEFHEVIGDNEVTILKAEGFILSEIRELLSGLKTSLDHADMVSYRRSRIQWWNDRRRSGWSKGQISQSIRNYYHNTGNTAWDEFRAEYMPSPRKKTLVEYRQAVAKRKRARVITKSSFRLLKTKPRQPFEVSIKGRTVRI